ncbi:MAG: PAS domain S-box protein [Spirochaetia bacterium]|nr:PAS domain S-box protein [Spirochaetia bacterium]
MSYAGEKITEQFSQGCLRNMDLVQELFLALDNVGTIILINSFGSELLGYQEQDLIGENWFDTCLPSEEVNNVRRKLEQIILDDSSTVEPNENTVLKKDGSTIIIHFHNRTIKDTQGEVIGILASGSDVSRQRENERLLQESHEYYKTLFDHSGTANIIIEEDMTISQVNSSFEELSKYSAAEIEGIMPWTDFVDPQDQKRMKTYHQARRDPDKSAPNHYGFKFKDKDNFIHNTLIQIKLVPETKKSIASLTDITKLHQTEQKLVQTEGRYRQLFTHMPTGFALYEIMYDSQQRPVDYRFLEVNPAYEELTGMQVQQVIGKTVKEVIHGTEPEWIDTYKKIVAERGPEEFEKYSQALNKWFRVRAFAVGGNQIATLITDITENKRTEQQLRDSASVQTLLAEVSREAVWADDIDAFQQTTLEKIGSSFNASRAYLFAFDKTVNTLNNAYEWCADGILPQKDNLQNIPADEFHWWMQTLLQNHAICYSDIQEIPDPGTREILQAQDILSILVVPLFIQEQLYGFLGIDKCSVPRNWSEEDQKILFSLAQIISRAIEKRQLQDEVAQNEEYLRKTIHSIGDGMIITDIYGIVKLTNPEAEILTGFSQAEAVGQPIAGILHLVDEVSGEPRENPVDRVLETGLHAEMERRTQLIAKSGKRYSISVSAAPIQESGSSLAGVVLVFRDITEEIKTEEMMQHVAKLESLGNLAGGLAHDFNNLLGGIFGYTQLAQASLEKGEDCSPYLQEIFSVFDEAKGLTQQLLTFTKEGHLDLKPHSLGPVIKEAASFYLSGSNIHCTYEFPDDLSLAEIDIGQFKQVIQNLIINTQQAMPNGGTITISAENTLIEPFQLAPLKEGAYVHIRIADEGVGIPKSILNNIFEPFFTTKQQGSGLGLASCYSILRNHKGLITVDSEVNSGTTFHLYLPSSSDTAVPAEAHTSAANHKGMGRVLVMDDEPYMRDVLTKMLESMGYTVTAVSDGKAVLELYPQFSDAVKQTPEFAAAFFDLTIPGGMGGRETLEKLQEASWEAIPYIFACSGYSQEDIIAHPNKHGFTDGIQKPFKIEGLKEFLNKHLNNKGEGG